ncbi:MAG: hypothetical protein KDK05_25250, partial [Candidatus Competibacteraceae bacterium]|nr:hypothetical protein [Candidatus Competibacteraceae bacterium]
MRYGPMVVNQVSMWADKLPGMADWYFSKPINEQQAQDLNNLSQAGNSASSGDPNGFDPNKFRYGDRFVRNSNIDTSSHWGR